MTASFPLSLAFLAKRGTSERIISRITNGRTVRNRIFSKLNSLPVIERMATCLSLTEECWTAELRDSFALT